MNTIYLPIEIKSREFLSRLLIALETAKIKPFEIFIGYKGDVNFYAKNFNPGIYYGLSSTENLENLDRCLLHNLRKKIIKKKLMQMIIG